jgi:hypothetical protein
MLQSSSPHGRKQTGRSQWRPRGSSWLYQLFLARIPSPWHIKLSDIANPPHTLYNCDPAITVIVGDCAASFTSQGKSFNSPPNMPWFHTQELLRVEGKCVVASSRGIGARGLGNSSPKKVLHHVPTVTRGRPLPLPSCCGMYPHHVWIALLVPNRGLDECGEH